MKKALLILLICSNWQVYAQNESEKAKKLIGNVLSDTTVNIINIYGDIYINDKRKRKTKSQDSIFFDGNKNQLKINLLPLTFGMPQIAYDRRFKDNFTIGGSLNFSLAKVVPFYLNLGSDELTFTNDELSSFGIMPQFKWYPPTINDKAIPNGFYIGGLIRYNIIEYNSDVRYDEGDLTPDVNFIFNAKLESFAIGFEVGYQIEFDNNILLDFSFLRPRYVFNTISYDSNIALQDQILDALTDEINDYVGFNIFVEDLGRINLSDRETFSNFGFGYAISVGYRF